MLRKYSPSNARSHATRAGTFIAAAGVIYLAVQYTLYKAVVARLGRFWTMVLGTAVYGPLSFGVPFSLLIEVSEGERRGGARGVNWRVAKRRAPS